MAQSTSSIRHGLTSKHWSKLAHLNLKYRHALLDQRSLTLRAYDYCKIHQGAFFLNVTTQEWQTMSRFEATHLKAKDNRSALIRQVAFGCNQHTLITARSVIPKHTWQINRLLFKKLGDQSLGQLLFKHAFSYRQTMWFSRPGAAPPARLSLFYLNDAPLLVEETFFYPL